MRFATFESDVTSVGVSEEASISIESNATAFYAQIAGLAENKIGYPIRELGSNAWDAAHGDVDVSLPTEIDPTFSVRDYGPGLSHAFMMDEYARAYVSTKRDDPTKIGGWGLGRFSPFAYLLSDEEAGMYLITSWHGGEQRDYVMVLEGDGKPRIKLLNTVASAERTGLMVSFQVKPKDIDAFAQQAREIFWSFDPRPRLSPAQTFDDRAPLSQGEGWRTYPHDHAMIRGPHVLLGCVLYKIDMAHADLVVPSLITDKTNIVFQAQAGTIRPTLSREDLAYTTNTVKSLSEMMQNYAETVVGALQHQVDRAPSLFDADRLVTEAGATLSSQGFTALREAVRWREFGVPATLQSDPTARYMLLNQGWNRAQVTEFDGAPVLRMRDLSGATVAIEHNTGHSLAKIEAAGLVGKKVLWVRSKAADRVAALNRIGMPEAVNLDAHKAEVKNMRPKTVRKRIFWRFGRTDSPKRETIEVDTTHRHMYFRVNRDNAWSHRYQTIGERYDSMGPIAALVRQAFASGVFEPHVQFVYVLPIAMDQAEIPAAWVPFVPWLCEQLTQRFNPDNLSPHNAMIQGRVQPPELRYLHTHTRPILQHAPPEIATVMRDLWQSIRRPERQPETPDDRIWKAMADVGHRPVERPTVRDGGRHVFDRWNDLVTQHPLLKNMVDNHYGWSANDFDRKITAMEREYTRLLRLEASLPKSEVA